MIKFYILCKQLTEALANNNGIKVNELLQLIVNTTQAYENEKNYDTINDLSSDQRDVGDQANTQTLPNLRHF